MDFVDRFKLSAALFIWLLGLLGGVAPMLSSQRVSKKVSSVLNMVAAGIFLASSCMHLLPDAQNNAALTEWGCEHTAEVFLAVRTNFHGDGKHCFKWANFFYGCGFLLVLLIEVMAHTLQRRMTDKVHGHGHGHAHAEQEQEALLAIEVTRTAEIQPDGHSTGHSHSHSQKSEKVYGTQGQETAGIQGEEVEQEGHSHIHGIVKGNPILAMVVFIALSFHSVMEGMGMGASSDAAWDILVAILAHKSLAAFALALEFLHHNVSRTQLLATIAVFSFMTPAGILFGRMLVDSGHTTPAGGICAAFAGGTFLFVAIMEIIPQELQDPRFQLEKCAALLTGYSAMGVLSLWT